MTDLNRKQIAWIIVMLPILVTLPILLGALVWWVSREPIYSLLLAIIGVILFIIVQTYLEQFRKRVESVDAE